MSGKRLIVAVTGASGFVGRALVTRLAADPSIECRGCYRMVPPDVPEGVLAFATGEITAPDWSAALAGADVVVHTVARTHRLREDSSDPLAAYRETNVAGTIGVARAAATAGVKRFVFLSSIKVNGESTPIDRPFTADDEPRPEDAYGIAKWEAEQALWAICAETGVDGVVLRPPLIYGPGVKGNLRMLEKLIATGVPLPFASIRNKRSLIGLESFVERIRECLTEPAAAGRTLLVADDPDLSTPELIEMLAARIGRTARLWPCPPWVIVWGARVIGRSAMAERLVGSLRVGR